MRIISLLLLLFSTIFSGLSAQCPDLDFSHLETSYDLMCEDDPFMLTAVPGGSADIAVTWDVNGAFFSTENTVIINESGVYTLTLTDAEDCSETFDFLVQNVGLGTLPTGVILQNCYEPGDDNLYCLDFFNFNWDIAWPDGQSGSCVTGLLPGEDYAVTISRGSNCSEVTTVFVPITIGVQVNATVNNDGPCSPGYVEVSVVEDEVLLPYDVTYVEINTGQTFQYTVDEIGPFINPLPPGTYNIIVMNGIGCIGTLYGTVTLEAGGVGLEDVFVQSATCNGATDGCISFIISGENGPFTVEWADLSGPGQPTERCELSAGTYVVTVTDSENCSVQEAFEIEESDALEIVLVENNPANCGENNGSLRLEVDGVPAIDLQFFWSNGWDTEFNQGLAAGDYTVTVTNFETGCEAIATYTVEETNIEVFIDATGSGWLTCEIESVTLFANPSGANFLYQWFGPGVDGLNTPTITVTEPGTYFVEVALPDSPGCIGSEAITIEEFIEPVSFEITQASSTNCNAILDSIAVNITSGDGDFFFLLYQDGNLLLEGLIEGPFFQLFNIQPGEYELEVISQTSFCTGIQSFSHFPGDGFELEFEADFEDCGEAATSLAVIPIGGQPPYQYAWSNGSMDSVITDMPAANYFVTVTDASGCVVVEDFNTTNVNNLEVGAERVHPSCEQDDGALFAFATGGADPYTFEWSTGEVGSAIDGLVAGEYILTVTDANGCTAVRTFALFNTLYDVGIEFTVIGGECEGEEATVSASPILPGFTYRWTGPEGFTFVGTSFTTNIPGEYTLSPIDPDTECEGLVSADIQFGTGFSAEIIVEPEPCNTYTVLTVIFDPEVNPELIESSWTMPDGTVVGVDFPAFWAVMPGLYTYTATHVVTGCVTTATVFLAEVGSACAEVTGRLWADEGNCQLDGTEIPVPSWLVRIETNLGEFVAQVLTDNAGFFSLELPPGDYIAYANPYNSDLYTDCPDAQPFTVDGDGNGYVDVFMPYVEECAAMYVSVSIPTLRRCFQNDIYVFYCNDGPVVAQDAQITLELDPFLDFIEASIPFSSIDAHTVTFDVGDLAPFECGFINVTVLASCEAELGQIHCVEATATPNDPCPNPANWNGANLSLSASCDGETIEFLITNDGTETLSEPLQYIVIEDGIMMMSSPVTGPALAPGESLSVPLPANGSTYHFQTTQEAGNPGFPAPTLVVEGCGVNADGTFSTGFVNQLPLGDNSTDWYDISCRDNTGSFDPNDKMGLPSGVSDRHFIEEGTTITYDIQFQNTGTDTAFTVVIRDTIAPEFDLESLRMGAASHDYTYDIDEHRALTITFDNILLPDSTVDLRGSQGVVQYTIDHVAGLPLGTELRNQAAIYFDFNEPIYTSTTLHTLGEDFLSTLIPPDGRTDVRMLVYPNPAGTERKVNVLLPVEGAYRLEVYDALGRLVLTQDQELATATLDLSTQQNGWYVIRAIRPNGDYLSVERLLLQ